MTISHDPAGWYGLERDVTPEAVAQLHVHSPVVKLSLTKIPLVSVKLAQRLHGLQVDRLWLWATVTRRAMQHIVQLPGLRVLDVLDIRGPGILGSFHRAHRLEEFRANCGLKAMDLIEVAQCGSLKELGAQNAALTRDALAAILELPQLRTLDVEATRFDDKLAKQLSRSPTIEALDVGATRLTGAGLAHLTHMQQLKSLDLWATRITESDLPLLLQFPQLEYLSLGNYDGFQQLNAEAVCNTILQLPHIKRVWLDGVHLQPAQKEALEQKLESLRVTLLPDFSVDA